MIYEEIEEQFLRLKEIFNCCIEIQVYKKGFEATILTSENANNEKLESIKKELSDIKHRIENIYGAKVEIENCVEQGITQFEPEWSDDYQIMRVRFKKIDNL